MSFFEYFILFAICIFAWLTYKVIPSAVELLRMRKEFNEKTQLTLEAQQKLRIITEESIDKMRALEEENSMLKKENEQLKQKIFSLENSRSDVE